MHKKRLGEQIAGELLSRISSGLYIHTLPGELELASELKVSRTALRDGLAQLESSGVIQKTKGRPTRILAEKTADPARKEHKLVLLVNDSEVSHQFGPQLVLLQKELYGQGLQFECIVSEHLPPSRLQAIITARPRRVYALIGTSPSIQAVFATAKLPTLVIGTAHAGLGIPCVDADYQAIAAHATGLLRSHYYQQIVFVKPATMLPGDTLTLQYFQSAAAAAGLKLTVVSDSHPAHFIQSLISAVSHGSLRTAVFCCRSTITLKTLLALLQQGIRLPHDVGLLSRDYMPLFDDLEPAVSGYDCKIEISIQRATDTLVRMIRGDPVHNKQQLVIPEFRKGATI